MSTIELTGDKVGAVLRDGDAGDALLVQALVLRHLLLRLQRSAATQRNNSGHISISRI
jgi:hypothetical protein